MVLKSGSVDTSSDLSDQSSGGQRSEARPRAKQSPLAASPSQSEPDEATPQVRPELYLTLKFDEESSLFVVNVDRVVSLPPKADGSAVDAYVRLFLIPRLTDLTQRRTAKTQTRPNSLSPVFNEDISYDRMSRDELINSTLHLEVLDYQSNGKHQLLGGNTVQLANITFVEGEAPVKLVLNPPEVCVCVCVWVGGWVRACVRVCACACMHACSLLFGNPNLKDPCLVAQVVKVTRR